MIVVFLIAGIYFVSLIAASVPSSALSTSSLASSPRIILRPFTSSPGKTVKVTGINFTPYSPIAVYFAGGMVANTVSNLTGGFVSKFVVPKDAPAGLYPVSAMDGSGKSGSNILNVTLSPKIKLGATSGKVGEKVSISGSGYISNSKITILFNNKIIATTSSDSAGSFVGSFVVPLIPTGSYAVSASDGTNKASKAFTVVRK